MNPMQNNPMVQNMMNNMVGKVMQNNPIMAIINVARNGGNPMDMLKQLAPQNPQVAQAMKMMEGKSPQQLKTMVNNMAKERGTTVEQVAQSLGIPMPQGK